MSDKSWLEEFYPVPANSEEAKRQPAAHSLRKWIGLRVENLDKHGLDSPPIDIDGGTCALCEANDACRTCVLWEVRGGVSCDSTRTAEGRSPFSQWEIFGNQEPMIKWLELAAREEANER